MANRFTRVPAGSPPLDATQLRLLLLADLSMRLMLSRPGGLSLRTTWVTPASIWLCAAVALPGLVLGLLAVWRGITGGHPVSLVAGLVALLVALGCASIAVYGARQRLLARRQPE